jgi:peptide chain release factor 1
MIPVDKLQTVVRRRSEIDDLMCEPKVIGDSARIQALSRERSQILPLVEAFGEWQSVEKRIGDAEEMLSDAELGALAPDELGER